jgi:energy-coupling factor transport system permease protein
MDRFTRAYSERDSILHRLNPITVATYAFGITVLGAFGFPLVLVASFMLTLVLARVGRVGRPFTGMMLRIIIPIAIPLFIIQSLFNPIGQTVLLEIGPLAVKQEGLDFAVNVITRLLALVGAYFLLVLVVHPRDLIISLEDRGMSPKLGYLLLSTLQLVPQIQRTAETILEAQRSRGLSLEGNIIHRFRAYIPLMGPVVMGSLDALETRALSLEARGFNLPNRKVYLRILNDSRLDRLLRLFMMVAVGVLVGASLYARLFGD